MSKSYAYPAVTSVSETTVVLQKPDGTWQAVHVEVQKHGKRGWLAVAWFRLDTSKQARIKTVSGLFPTRDEALLHGGAAAQRLLNEAFAVTN